MLLHDFIKRVSDAEEDMVKSETLQDCSKNGAGKNVTRNVKIRVDCGRMSSAGKDVVKSDRLQNCNRD